MSVTQFTGISSYKLDHCKKTTCKMLISLFIYFFI